MVVKYIQPTPGKNGLNYTAPFTAISSSGGKTKLELLWGDRVELLEPNTSTAAGEVDAKARGRKGRILSKYLGDTALLEVYFIDVGQGDGILIATPETAGRRHIMIDGGNVRSKQQTRHNAADFVDWKFNRDYGLDQIELDAIIASHCDLDHYGGLYDLVNPDPKARQDLHCKTNVIHNFYHAGVSHWCKLNGEDFLGEIADHAYLTWLLEDRASAVAATDGTGARQLYGTWRDFISAVLQSSPAINVQRISHLTGYLPGYAPAPGALSIRVLAPYAETYHGQPAIKSYNSPSFDTNGNSIVLRLDYGQARILLNGDLNRACQTYLLEQYAGDRMQFACDVAKSCHHGSDDVSYAFMQAMNAAATVISSGDSESYGHPRPNTVAASALTGFVKIRDDELITPLVYSTEIERSYKLSVPLSVRGKAKIQQQTLDVELAMSKTAANDPQVLLAKEKQDDGSYREFKRPMHDTLAVRGVVYGLVNVRTDGQTILCATMNEAQPGWNYKVFDSRF